MQSLCPPLVTLQLQCAQHLRPAFSWTRHRHGRDRQTSELFEQRDAPSQRDLLLRRRSMYLPRSHHA